MRYRPSQRVAPITGHRAPTAQVLVLPSLAEETGLPAAEALAVGRPVAHWPRCASVAEITQQDGVAVDEPIEQASAIERAS